MRTIVQERRTSGGWVNVRSFQREESALELLRKITDQGIYRAIQGDPHGVFEVVAMKCPAS